MFFADNVLGGKVRKDPYRRQDSEKYMKRLCDKRRGEILHL